MSDEFVIVKILSDQPDGRLDKSALCGQIKRVPRESIDEKNKEIEVRYLKKILYYFIRRNRKKPCFRFRLLF